MAAFASIIDDDDEEEEDELTDLLDPFLAKANDMDDDSVESADFDVVRLSSSADDSESSSWSIATGPLLPLLPLLVGDSNRKW